MKWRKNSSGEVVDAQQWWPGVFVRGVQEIVHDAGGETVSNGYGFAAVAGDDARKIEPGDWVVTAADGARQAVQHNVFQAEYRPVE